MSRKVAIVTGGNAGIGKETVKGLLERGFHVVMACRNLEKAEQSKKDIVHETGQQELRVLKLDLGSTASIRNFIRMFSDHYDRLDVLVNNAGVFFSKYGETIDGFERQFGINHLGPFLLTYEFIPLMIKSAPARIINVSSAGHYKGVMNWNNLNQNADDYNGRAAYRQSKLANVLFTKALAKRLDKYGITSNALHPGVVRTEIGNKSQDGIEQYVWRLIKPFMISAAKGAETSIFLASDPSVESISGKYFDKCKEKQSSDKSYIEEDADNLWTVSLALLNIKDKYSEV